MRRLIALCAVLLVTGAAAIEPPQSATPAEPAPATQQPAATPAPEAEPRAADEEEEKLPPLPADALPAGPPPARFDPTEKVRADFPVSFPIDI